MKSEKQTKRRYLSRWRESRARRLKYQIKRLEKMVATPCPEEFSEQRRNNVERVRASYIARLPIMRARLAQLT